MEPNAAEKKSGTGKVIQIIKDAADFDASIELIKDQFSQQSVRAFFHQLLARKNMKSADVVNRAGMDRDFGRQVVNGERKTRRDNYIRLGIALRLTFHETQRMLRFLQSGPIYVMRPRDAAIMYCIEKRFDLMDTQLLLDEYAFLPLGDGKYNPDDDVPLREDMRDGATRRVEQIVKDAASFTEVLDKTDGMLVNGTIEQYFHRLLEQKGMEKNDLFAKAHIKPNIGYQLLSGIRKSRNRDVYLKIAIELRLTYDETQQMLNLVGAGVIDPVREREAAVVFGMTHGQDLAWIQALLAQRDLLPL